MVLTKTEKSIINKNVTSYKSTTKGAIEDLIKRKITKIEWKKLRTHLSKKKST